MAYDPTKPADGSLADAAELRNQLAGLKTLIDAKVNTADLDAAIVANSSGPTAGLIEYLNITVSDPPSAANVQAIVDRLNDLISLLRRN